MKSTEETTHAFIIRIWVEPRDIQGAEPTWRGVIEHVGSGARVYFKQLEEISGHLRPYVKAMGMKIDDHQS